MKGSRPDSERGVAAAGRCGVDEGPVDMQQSLCVANAALQLAPLVVEYAD